MDSFICALCSVKRTKMPAAGSAWKNTNILQGTGPRRYREDTRVVSAQWGISFPSPVCVRLGNYVTSPPMYVTFPRAALLAWRSPGICLVDQPQGRAK